MIKRRPCLSVAAGGTVSEVPDTEGKMRKLTTFCRLYNTSPHKRGILCLGFMDYPPCPDLSTCRKIKPVPEKVLLDDPDEVI